MWYKIKRTTIWDNQVFPKSRTFTITWTEASDPTQFNPVYSDDAAWLTAWSTAFDEFFWYYGCRLSDAWVETATVKQSSPWTLDITQLGTLTSGNNVMIAFPRRWIKMSKSWSNVTLSITEAPNKDWFQYYAHTKWEVAKDTLYIWTYVISWNYVSLSWASPLTNVSKDGYVSNITTKYWSNTGYSLVKFYPRMLIIAYYMMKYWNPNIRGIIWNWNTYSDNVSYIKATWWTNSSTNASYWDTQGTQSQMKLFWLEDWVWNVDEFIDWFRWNNEVEYDNNWSYRQLWNFQEYYTKSIVWTNDGMFLNAKWTSWWSGSTYYIWYQQYDGTCPTYRKTWLWYTNLGYYYWLLSFRWSNSTSYAYKYYGSRLMYL